MKLSFGRKFLYTFGLLLAVVTGLKLGVDSCLPNPEGQVFTGKLFQPAAICRPLRSWDDTARYRNALTRNSSSIFFPFEKNSVDRLTMLDLAIFWKAPSDMTILLGRAPNNVTANLKICLFLISCALYISFVWHYVARVFETVTAFPKQPPPPPAQTQYKNDELILPSGKKAVLDWGKREDS